MNGQAAYEQSEQALLRVFYMLVVSFLFAIQAAMASRGAFAHLSSDGASPRHDALMVENLPPLTPDELRLKALDLLDAIDAAACLLASMLMRTVHELMNQADMLTGRERAGDIAHQCALSGKRLDSS